MSAYPGRRTRPVTLALLASLTVAACTGMPGAPGAPAKPGGAPSAPQVAPISVGTAAIVRDILSPTLSYSGNVQAQASVNLVPKITGRLEKLNADVGDEVKAGDVIAELDHDQLDAQVTQSQAAVNAAQAKLEQTQASAKPEDIQAAQAVVDQAKAKLDQARAGGRPEEIAGAQAQAAQAQAKAEQVASGARDFDVQGLQAAIDTAEAQQDQLQAQLTASQSSLSEAQYRLDQARAGQGGPGVRPEDIVQAQATLASNQSKLDQIRNPRPEDIRSAAADVEQAKASLEAAINARENCGQSETTTRSSSTQRTAQGSTSSSTRSTAKQNCPDAQKDQLDALIDAARASVASKQAALDKIRNPSQYDIQQAQEAVGLAQANLQKLQYGGTNDVAALQLRVSSTQADVDRLQGALDQASAAISSAQAKLASSTNPDPNDVAQAVAAANQARANLAKTANPDPFNVQQNQATVDQAQAQLASRLQPFTAEDIRVAAAGVDQAAAALQASKVQSAEANVVAPFDALVSQKLINPGALASPTTPIVGLVSRDVEIDVQVEEARIGQLQKGQPATLSVSAFPGRLIPAVVAAIAPSADPKSRTFAVRIVPSQQDGTLRDGMFAQVNISGVGQEALLVPNDAVVTRAGRSQVFVVVNNQVQAREVKLGDTDGKHTVVLDGKVNPGDEVVVTNPEALTDGAPVVVEQRNVEPSNRSVSPNPSGSQPGTQPGAQSSGQSGGAPSSPRENLPGTQPDSQGAGQPSGQGR